MIECELRPDLPTGRFWKRHLLHVKILRPVSLRGAINRSYFRVPGEGQMSSNEAWASLHHNDLSFLWLQEKTTMIQCEI